MVELLFFALAAGFLYKQIQALPSRSGSRAPAKRLNPKLTHFLEYGSRLYAQQKYRQAEKSYLQALSLDHKNATAYTRLGMIYSHQRNFDDAIECFQIVTRLDPSATSFYNLGLTYFESKNYPKAIAAYEKSLMFQPAANRYIGLAKAHQKAGSATGMLAALERAADLTPTPAHLNLLAEAYAKHRQPDKAAATRARLAQLDKPTPGTVFTPAESTASSDQTEGPPPAASQAPAP